jgi:hypothetical protein
MMPPGLALKFTVGERACLYVIATEIKRRGACSLYVDAIAAFAGVCRSTAKNAIRAAKRLRLIEVTERKLAPDWNAANIITIVAPEWLTWLAHGRTEMTVKKMSTTNQPDFNPRAVSRGESPRNGFPTKRGGDAVPRGGP